MKNLKAISELVSENSQFTNKLNEATIYANKWHETGLLEGLAGLDKTNTAILLENQARQLIRESSSNTTTGDEEWSGVALPLVRRLMDNMNAKNLVSVQPMSLPSGLVFYLDFETTSGNSVYGDVENGNPTGGLYSKNTGTSFSYSDGSSSTAVLISAIAPSIPTIADVNYDNTVDLTELVKYTLTSTTANIQIARLKDMHVSISGAAWADDATNGLSNYDTAASASNGWLLNQYTKMINDTTITIIVQTGAHTLIAAECEDVADAGTGYGEYSEVQLIALGYGEGDKLGTTLAADITAAASKIEYPSLTIATRNGTYEDTSSDGTTVSIPELNLKITQSSIIAKIRKLKAIFSPEVQQDLQAYQAIDANVELTRMLADKISAEIDLEILEMLANGADKTNVERWSARPGYTWNGTAWVQNSNYHITSKTDWFRTLGTKIRKISNMIYKKTLTGGVNFIVVSPEVATIFESMGGFNGQPRSITTMSFGVQEIGLLNNEITVYKNPYWTTNKILLGHKGAGSLDTGAVYAPYIPLMTTPLIFDANNFTPRKGVASRYATKLLRPEFYGTIWVDGLETV